MQFNAKRLVYPALLLGAFALGWMTATAGAGGAAVAVPVKLSRADLDGGAFERFQSVQARHETGGQAWDTTDAEIFLSPDRQFDAGVYKSGALRLSINEDYGVHEFMYFLEGGVILTSTDGSRVEIGPGEGVLVPANWRGEWHSPDGYRKIYVIYSPEGPISE